MLEEANKTIVIGHKNPDTDSICSAICYARYKEKMTGGTYIAGRAGNINPETQFVLDYFKVEAPELVKSVRTQVKDIEVRQTRGVDKNISLRKAWDLMQELNVVTLPAVNRAEITVGDITRSYMNVYDSTILSKAKTRYSNIVETLEGELIVGDKKGYFDRGKVLIAAANPDIMESFIEKGDLVILGNRYESQLCAIEMDAACIIVSGGSEVSLTIRKLAAEHGCTIIKTHYDTYTTARLMNQSMPISYFMKKSEDLITFRSEDYINDIKDIMASKRFRDFPVLNPAGKYVGMISRRNVIAAKGKNVMLVDHNERNQAVDGIEDVTVENVSATKMLRVFEIDTDVLYQWRDIVPTFETRITRIRNISILHAEAEQSEAVYELRGDARDPIDGIRIEDIHVKRLTKFDNNAEYVRNLQVRNIQVDAVGEGEGTSILSGFAPGR